MWPYAPQQKLFMPAFGLHLPESPTELQAQNIFPLAMLTDRGFDLDYSSLLLCDGLILDKAAYGYVKDNKLQSFREMTSSIDVLSSHGLVEFVDYAASAEPFRAEFVRKVDALIETPEVWIDAARAHWRVYRKDIPGFIARFGKDADPKIEQLNFGVYCHLRRTSDRIDFAEAERLQALLEGRRRRFEPEERQALREIIRPFLSQVVFNHGLRQTLNSTFLDWHDLDPYYRGVDAWQLTAPDIAASRRGTVSREHLAACRELFDVAIPDLRPGCAHELAEFAKNKVAVGSLRKRVRAAVARGETFDAALGNALRDSAIRNLLTYKRGMRVFSFIRLALRAVGPFLPWSELVAEMFHETLEFGGDSVAERGTLGRDEWLYTLVDLKERRLDADRHRFRAR
jgi:hypothetical protein